jgi:hypothetical protein
VNQDLTDITIVLDESGSMGPIRGDTIGALNTFVQEQKAIPGNAVFSLYTFSSGLDKEYQFLRQRVAAVNLKDAQPLTDKDYTPAGGTPLLDALGTAIDSTGIRLGNLPEDQRPARVLFVIVTDGKENASTKFDTAAIREKIKHQDEVYSWDFVYLGANQDAFAVSSGLGISAGNTSGFEATSGGIKSMTGKLSSNAVNYRSGGATRGSYFVEPVGSGATADSK